MQHNVMVVSRQDAIAYSSEVAVDTVIVSISNIGEDYPVFDDNPHILDVCFVAFDDEESGSSAMDEDTATDILDFISDWIDEDVDIVVHCGAGVSRSAGTAAAIMLLVNGDDSDIFDSPKYSPNMNCYRKMLAAAGLGLSNWEIDEKEQRQFNLWLELARENGLI